MIHTIYLEELSSFKENIKVKYYSDTVETHIGTKTEESFTVTGNVSISIEDFKKEQTEALENMMEDSERVLVFEFEYAYVYENEVFYVVDDYRIENGRVIFDLEC